MDYRNKEEVTKEIEEKGFKCIYCDFKNDRSKVDVEDSEGYKGRIGLGILMRGDRNPCMFSCKNPYVIDNIKKWMSINAPNLTLLSESYGGDRIKLHFKCKFHGDYFSTLSNVKAGYNCGKCSKIDFSKVVTRFEEKGFKVISSKNDFYSSKQKLILENEEGYRTVGTYSQIDKFTPMIFSSNNPFTFENIKKWLNLNGNGTLEIRESVYENAHSQLNLHCNVHKIDFKMTWNNLSRGKRCKQCYFDNNRGANNPSFNPNLTDEERQLKRYIYGKDSYANWRSSVFKRDEYTCDNCGQVSGKINAHHKNGWNKYVEDRMRISNGVTLCSSCHKDFHKNYGNKDNTESQYIEWKLNYRNN